MKNKKLFIILGSTIIIIGIIICLILFNKKEEPIKNIECIPFTGGSYNLKFEVDGGEKIEDMSICIACSPDSYESLPIPVKEGYTFEGWYYDSSFTNKVEIEKTYEITPIDNIDKNGCKIGYKDITLYAKYTKNIVYSCNEGYTLDGTKCIKTIDSIAYCPDGTREYNGNCINLDDFKETTRKCKKTTYLIDGNGHTATSEGTLVQAGTSFCYYGETGENKEACTNNNHKWASTLNKCFYDSTGANQNIEYSCPDSDREYIANPLNTFNVAKNGGCYKKSGKSFKCENGYTLDGTRCVIVVDAIAN